MHSNYPPRRNALSHGCIVERAGEVAVADDTLGPNQGRGKQRQHIELRRPHLTNYHARPGRLNFCPLASQEDVCGQAPRF